MKHLLTFLFLVISLGSIFAQKDVPADYQELMKSYQAYTSNLTKATETLVAARQAYAASVHSALSEQAYAENAAEQTEWMTNTVPELVGTQDDNKLQNQQIDQWTSAFCEQFGIGSQSCNNVRKELRGYAKAYKQYAAAYTQLKTAMGDGSMSPPPPPPPPPPTQQHHY